MKQYKVIQDFPNNNYFVSGRGFTNIKKGDIITSIDICNPENYPHLFELIPTKTPNPSEEKGFVNNTLLEIFNDCKEYIKYNDFSDTDLIERIDNYIQANGETPEVDNPVPSLDFYSSENKDKSVIIRKNGVEIAIIPLKADYIVEDFVKYLNGRETDKVEPKCNPDNCTNGCAIYGCQNDSNNHY